MNKSFFVFLIGVFMISGVFALGVSPARTTMDFEAGVSKEVSFEVVNSGGQDIELALKTEGELGEYIKLEASRVLLSSSEESKRISYTVNLPSELSPGQHTGGVVISEVAKTSDSAGSYVQATLAVSTQLHVYAAYPGKYANANLYVYGADVGENVRFVIPVVSAGDFDLDSVWANVDIYNKLGEKVDSFNIDSVSIASGTKKELVYDWKADVAIGSYFAKVTVVYDEGSVSLEEAFDVGSQELELQEINVGDFTLGQIVKLEMLIENKWSEDIKGVFVETSIMDKTGKEVSAFESVVKEVSALSKTSFVSYWDTIGVREGEYDVEVLINYLDKEIGKKLTFEVSDNDLVIVGLGYVISSGGEEGGNSNTIIIVLVIIIVLMVLINVFWFLALRKKLGGKK